MKRLRRHNREEAELDITSFMNLMIVLVPVLLLSLVFSQVRILNLQLPITSAGESEQTDQNEKQLELIITKSSMQLNYPAGVLLKAFSLKNSDKEGIGYDFAALASYLQDLKFTFQQQKIDKNDIVILLSSDINYQVIVTAMDTVKSFKTVVAANLVDAELFPNISLGDAPKDTVKQNVNEEDSGT